jgi:transforming growth factor-beta-induced protein
VAIGCLTTVLIGCASDATDQPSTTAPASSESTTTTTTTLAPYESPLGDVIGEALVAGQFTTLAGLLIEADLVQALRAAGPFTVFAPTDDAFAAVPSDTLDAVFADPDLLASVLTYHVVAGENISLADLQAMEDGAQLTTLQGSTLTVTHDGDSVSINGNPIVVGDVAATNGTIHVIGGVLVP